MKLILKATFMSELKFNLKKILVPTDFSDLSLTALRYAASMAKHSDAEITLLHVMQPYEHEAILNKIIDFKGTLQKAIQEKLNEIKKATPDLLGVPVTVKIVEGKIYEAIENIVKEEDLDLIVMGTHGAGGLGNLEKYVLGTNAYRTVHVSGCPVITLREVKEKIAYDNIILPLDMTKETKQKVDTAIKIAKVLGSTIHVVSVTTFVDEFRYNLSEIKGLLQEVADKVKAAGVKVVTEMLRHDDIADSILKYSEEVNADLVVIMTRQEGKLNDIVVGSSARKIITKSKVPVLSLRPRE
jgi:nucleotide-binding universal stress UspA family protein